MRRGCISLGDVQCDGCQRPIPYPERYLVIDEAGGTLRLCTNCCVDRGYARYTEEKGQRALTFFSEEPQLPKQQ